ncbi:HNH endonuclease signature motif containing protein [Pseudomonas paralcaligenes]|uniref:HNH endonuclease signature motif containing protein n=1 Tax=Pseudomonas paralcaligenes TaxID=2772558 RepID=UPI001C818294|nr:HNH endonuclease signature motif containing protein [Pseudomonas paralcaligenes]
MPLKFLRGHALKVDNQGPKSPNWKGGRQISSHGYVVRWTPEGRRYEHILLAEQALGRKLHQIAPGHPENEVVHHIDGDKQNNSPANLLICTHRYHIELHHRLEAHPDWPQFQKVERFTKEKARARHDRPSQ